jgi:endonuclease-3
MQKLKRIHEQLVRAYDARPWKCWGRGVDVLVDTILSQNTNAANSEAGYRQLRRRFRSWNEVADAHVREVERHIRVSGLSNQKAPWIQQILRQIKQDRGKMDLQFLKDVDDQKAYDYLTKFKGVGPKTANCVLLFAFGKKLFPVDTHIHRLAQRWGLTDGRNVEQTERDLKKLFPKDSWNKLHLQIIYYGREHCTARTCDGMRCDLCKTLYPKRRKPVETRK